MRVLKKGNKNTKILAKTLQVCRILQKGGGVLRSIQGTSDHCFRQSTK